MEVSDLYIAYIGPNLPHEYGDRTFFSKKIDEMDIKVEIERALFHESSIASSSESISRLDVVIAYNGGIWGYDSWAPTLISSFGANFQRR